MTPEAAIYSFFNGFGIPAYASTSVPDQDSDMWHGFPYMSYTLVTGEWDDNEVSMTVDVWYKTESEAEPNAKVREIYLAIGRGGVMLPCDNGAVWVKRGSPWSQVVPSEEADDMIKRRYVNISIEYLLTE